jgi:hypothetical protein
VNEPPAPPRSANDREEGERIACRT